MKQITKETYKIFWRHLRNHGFFTGIMIFSIIAAGIVDSMAPLYYKKFFDTLSLSPQGTLKAVKELSAIIIFILFLHSILWVFRRADEFLITYLQPRIMADLAIDCFTYIHRHSYGFFTNRFVGALVRKVNRLIDAFEGISERFFYELLPLAVRIIVILIVLFSRSFIIGILMAGWVFVYCFLIYLFTLYKLKYDEKAAEIDSRVTARLADTITNNANIKVFTSFRDEVRWFSNVVEEQFRIRRFIWNLDNIVNAVQSFFIMVLEFTIFYIAIRFWNRGELTIGDFVLIQVYLLQIFTRIWDFGRMIRKVYQNLANAEEMVEILTLPHEIQDTPNAKELIVKKGKIEFKDASFSYAKTREVIKNFTLSVSAGEKIGLVGKSGAGKSTLTSLLLRFFDLQDGAIFIDGQNIATVTQESLRRNISFVPQDPILFHRSLMENIRYGRQDASNEEVMRAARLAHCDEFIEKLWDKYDTFVGERGIKLSGGERQRVAIARAILKNAPILLLDEATSSLDSHSEQLIQDALSILMQNKTVVIIAHRLSTIMKMDRIIVVNEGNIVEIGSHSELLEREEGIYKQLWELQVGGFIA